MTVVGEIAAFWLCAVGFTGVFVVNSVFKRPRRDDEAAGPEVPLD